MTRTPYCRHHWEARRFEAAAVVSGNALSLAADIGNSGIGYGGGVSSHTVRDNYDTAKKNVADSTHPDRLAPSSTGPGVRPRQGSRQILGSPL